MKCLKFIIFWESESTNKCEGYDQKKKNAQRGKKIT